MQKRFLMATTLGTLTLATAAIYQISQMNRRVPDVSATFRLHSTLPDAAAVKSLLNDNHHHHEWLNIGSGTDSMRAFITYPQRSDKAPVVVVHARKQGATDWIRAVADQTAAQGFIAIVPDVLSGLGPNGGDGNSFPSHREAEAALAHLGEKEIERRIRIARDYAMALPAANGKSARLEFETADGPNPGASVKAFVESPLAGQGSSQFKASSESWGAVMAFLTTQTGDHPAAGENPNLPEDHSAHFGMIMAQAPEAQKKGGAAPRGYPTGKLPELPAGVFNAHSAVTNSKLSKEWVNIPMGNVQLHTWVEYPEGDGKAPIVIVMQHGPGMDDWQRAIADQLAYEGFIAIATDLHSGLGPNGGGFESFGGTDDLMRATARLTSTDMLNRYKAARDWGMKLPRANGRSASIGFCMGGGNSFRFAAEIPDLSAAVVFYGTPDNQEMFTKVKAPIIAFYGDDDARVTATMAPTEATMKRLGKSFEAHTYPHATHAFLSYQDLAGNPTATADSWPKAMAFLNEHTR